MGLHLIFLSPRSNREILSNICSLKYFKGNNFSNLGSFGRFYMPYVLFFPSLFNKVNKKTSQKDIQEGFLTLTTVTRLEVLLN